ncbi:MAG: SH3 domain-containing protein, partial [Lachnospiraceae bacterium]|nr:SH3 domain-containing protein [Lachnospiraceae bacterium]
AVVAMLAVMITVGGVSQGIAETELASIEVSDHATAGIVTVMEGVQTEAIKTAVTVDMAHIDVVASSIEGQEGVEAPVEETVVAEEAAVTEETAEEAVIEETVEEQIVEEAPAVDPEWTDKLMTTADDYVNVRTEASTESSLEGKLRRGDVAEITESVDGWYSITSGNLSGYVRADYVVAGEEAKSLAQDICVTYVKSSTGGLRVRSSASEDGDVMTALGEGEKLEYAPESDTVEGWTAVKYGDSVGYVKSEYASVYLATGTGITVEEESAALEAAKAEETAEAEAQQASNTVATVQNTPVAASYDDVTLLAALIQCEAGYEPYEGQLAVGAVVVNRLHSGYGGSIYDVIYARGQFSPAGSGSVAAVAAAGPRSSCIQAANEALSGIDNTGGAKNFRPTSSGHSGVVIGNQVFW